MFSSIFFYFSQSIKAENVLYKIKGKALNGTEPASLSTLMTTKSTFWKSTMTKRSFRHVGQDAQGPRQNTNHWLHLGEKFRNLNHGVSGVRLTYLKTRLRRKQLCSIRGESRSNQDLGTLPCFAEDGTTVGEGEALTQDTKLRRICIFAILSTRQLEKVMSIMYNDGWDLVREPMLHHSEMAANI
jgi:hypothetical protein